MSTGRIAWANLAESAFATGRFRVARLIARRVLEQRDVETMDPEQEPALRTILVCSLVREGQLEDARKELRRLADFMARGKVSDGWLYGGSKFAAGSIPKEAEKRFVLAMFTYAESAGKQLDVATLEHLLDEVGRLP